MASSNNPNEWDNPTPTNAAEEQRFLRMYSKALAEALRAKDEEEAEERSRLATGGGGGPRSSGSASNKDDKHHWEKMKTTYRELCFDDPTISGGDGDCRRLALGLIPSTVAKGKTIGVVSKTAHDADDVNKLALSTRLVDGVLQAIARAGANKAPSSSSNGSNASEGNPTNDNESNNNNNQEVMFGSSHLTTTEGYADLGFAIFVEGPYRCIQQADNLKMAASFLGSFLPPPENLEKESGNQQSLLNDGEKSRMAEETAQSILDGFEKMVLDEEEAATDGNVKSNDANANTNLARSPKNEENSAQNSNNNIPDDGSSSSSEFFYNHNNNIQNANTYPDDGSMQEIFAEESDPDDYEYESSFQPYSPSSDVNAIFGKQSHSNFTNNPHNVDDDYQEEDMGDDGFNPLQLSKPNATNQTWSGARKALRYLLSNSSYGKMELASISSRSWSERGMSDTLADLAFLLLLENAKEDGDVQSGENTMGKEENLFNHHQHHDKRPEEDIASLWDRPLFLLRDRAMDATRHHDALPAYLQLLRAFLAHSEEDVMSILSSTSSSTKPATWTDSLPPTTAVGLSCLATLCSSKEMTCASSAKMCGTSVWSVCPREEVRNVILSSLGAMSRIAECVRPRKSIFASTKVEEEGNYGSAERPWVRTVICIIPMMEFLVNLRARFDFQPVFEGGGSRNASLSDADAKSIMDSGLFRELLSLYTTTAESPATNDNAANVVTPNAVDVIRMQLLRTISALCIQSPDVLGSFAVRVPDLAKEVHSSGFMDKFTVDGILWTSLGSSLLESKSDAPQSRLKLRPVTKFNAKSAKGAVVETISLAECSLSGFSTLCESTKISLETLKGTTQEENDLSKDSGEEKKYSESKEALGDFIRFSNCLSNCPHATKMWLDSLRNKPESIQKAKDLVASLRSALSSMPSLSDNAEVLRTGHKKDDDDNYESSSAENDPGGEVEQKNMSMRQRRKEVGNIVASVRSSIKLITLALESHKESTIPLKGVASYNVSSKTD